MKEQLITFKTAKLAKEKGFDIDSRHAYVTAKILKSTIITGNKAITKDVNKVDIDLHSAFDLLGEENFTQNLIKQGSNSGDECWLAPIQSLLQKWLREVHHIEVLILKPTASFLPQVNGRILGNFALLSYEEALEIGLQEGLKLIKKNTNEYSKP
jgi:hypothetical protein